VKNARGAAAPLILALLVLTSPPAGAHPFDNEYRPPRSYAEAIHMIRDELQGFNLSREYGNRADLVPRATRLATLATAVPELAFLPASALPDSAGGPIATTSVRLRGLATSLQRAVADSDMAEVARLTTQCANLLAGLDAWVPAIYVCPMHCEPGRTYARPGLCPVCGMHLQRVTTDRYDVEVRPTEGTARARVPVDLHFRIRDPAGFDVTHLQVVHEKLLHLMVVSQDLSRFDHVHPTADADGGFHLRHVFPEGGRWFLFHDFTPDSVGMQVVPVEMTVAGPEPAPKTLVVDDGRPKRVDGCDVSLEHSALVPGAECRMAFTLSRNDRPVDDLEPFLGASGHLVMISQDRASYIHSHPLETVPGVGPRVEFRMRFERTGLYKAWGQFQRRGRVMTVPFVVEVAADSRSTRLAP
jgi:Heavy metal binding domain